MNTRRLLSDILELNNALNTDGFIMTIDIETVYVSFENFCFWKRGFISYHVINGNITTSYFKMEKGARQGDLISMFLFILVLEIVFIMIKSNQNIQIINIFDHAFLYIVYADDTTCFLFKNKDSAIEPLSTFHKFSSISGIKPNKSKCEIIVKVF